MIMISITDQASKLLHKNNHLILKVRLRDGHVETLNANMSVELEEGVRASSSIEFLKLPVILEKDENNVSDEDVNEPQPKLLKLDLPKNEHPSLGTEK